MAAPGAAKAAQATVQRLTQGAALRLRHGDDVARAADVEVDAAVGAAPVAVHSVVRAGVQRAQAFRCDRVARQRRGPHDVALWVRFRVRVGVGVRVRVRVGVRVRL